MRPAVACVATALLWALGGCADLPHRPPLESAAGGSRLAAARVRQVLRARVETSSSAEVELDASDGLSPDEAALLAVAHNPRLRAARARRGVARAELVAAGVLPNPRLSGTLDLPLSEQATQDVGYGAELSWNVTPLLSAGTHRAAARANLRSVELDLAWQEWQVSQSARLHAIRAVCFERRSALASELELTLQQRLDAVRAARAAGAATELELADAERAQAEAQVRRLELERRLAGERVELNRALGLDAERTLVLTTALSSSSTAPDRERLLAELPRRRLDLIALAQALRSRDQALRAAVIEQFPAVEIGFHVARELDHLSFAGAVVSVELPLFDRNQGAVARASAQRADVEAEYGLRLLEARADVVRSAQELAIVAQQLAAAHVAAEASGRLASQAQAVAQGGALGLLLVSTVQQKAYESRLLELEIAQTLAELQVALALASGSYGP